MPRPSNTAERRQQIAAALMEVMARQGYGGASVVAIAKAAGLAPGLVHYHFETKQEILVALVESLVATVRGRYQALAAGARTPREKLDAFIDAHLALGPGADPRAAAAWSVIGAEALRQPEVRALYRRAIARTIAEVKALFRACLRERRRPTRNAGAYAAAIVSGIEGAYRIAAAAPDALPRGFAAPTLKRAAAALLGD